MNAIPEQLGHDRRSPAPERAGVGRDLFFLHVANAAALSSFRLTTRDCVCLLVWDASREGYATLHRVAEQILDSGCKYLCAWGPDCERVHDTFDDVIVGDGSVVPEHVCTSWHAGDRLDEALWYFLNCTWPVDAFAETCGSAIAIVVGDHDGWAAAVRRGLADCCVGMRRRSPAIRAVGNSGQFMQTSGRRVPISERINQAATLGFLVGLVWFCVVPVIGIAIAICRQLDLWEMHPEIIARIALLGLCLGPVVGIALVVLRRRRGASSGGTEGT